ncbi:MAG: hypothetical protein ISR82_05645 [Candidatus Marinimicrobia bacterium]|nr:hypothetical protein [Candidatus Neomarinimicrobiota bacterium]MBL7010686.1 hypothetical protein [Candidatus Neomarinimicrobiota bacterium]MBL7031143.1 hypothetical protein [Candidatus Neomarinimicrobiota bacterium]
MGEFCYQSKNGRSYKCKKCAKIHIEYGTTIIELDINQFWKFDKYIKNINPVLGKDQPLMLPLLGTSIFCRFTQKEFEEFKLLISYTRKYLTDDYFMSIGMMNQLSGHTWPVEIDKTQPN